MKNEVARGCANGRDAGSGQLEETTHQSPSARPEHLLQRFPLHDGVSRRNGADRNHVWVRRNVTSGLKWN